MATTPFNQDITSVYPKQPERPSGMLGCLGSPCDNPTIVFKTMVAKGFQGGSHGISEASPLARFLSPISLSSNKEIGIKGEVQLNIAGGASPSPTRRIKFFLTGSSRVAEGVDPYGLRWIRRGSPRTSTPTGLQKFVCLSRAEIPLNPLSTRRTPRRSFG